MSRRHKRLHAPPGGRAASAGTPGFQHGDGKGDPLSRWLVHMLNSGQAQGNVACQCTVARTVSPALLTQAFRVMLARHDMLRTSYLELGGQLTPQRLDPAAFTLDTADLSDLADGERQAELDRRMRAEALKPFALSDALPVRAMLLTSSPGQAVLLAVAHDLACDAASLCMALHEVQETLLALEAGTLAPPGDAPQFAEHARRQLRHFAEAADRAGSRAPGGAPGSVRPTRVPGGGQCKAAVPRPARAELALPARAATMLAGIAPDKRLAVGAAAVAALLHIYSAEDEVAFGIQTSTRCAGDCRTIGRFEAGLALRVDASGDPDAAALLNRTEAALAEAHAGQHAPFGHGAGASGLGGEATARPALPVQFALRHGAAPGRQPFGTPEPFQAKPPPDLLFSLVLSEPARLFCDYCAGHRDAGAVQQLLRVLARLLEGMLSTPDCPVHALPLLEEAERRTLFDGLNQTVAAYPRASAVRLFDEQARGAPDATALVCGERRMGYADLAAAADRLARHLAAQGAKRGTRVGICLDRGPEMVVALLAVMKTGAAYVPLDPTYPAERLSYMLADCGARLVLCQAGLPPGVQAPGVTALALDEMDRAAEAPPLTVPDPAPEDSAYVIYTSGSTGRPKGAELPHRALTNLLNSMQRTLGVGASDTLLAVTTFSFDIAAMELLLPLVTGGRLVIARQPEVADGGALLELAQRHGVTVMQATPGRWRLLIEAGWAGRSRLKIVTGGEALQRGLADELLARGEVWNVYGPTETTIWSTAQRVAAELGDVPIGRPLDNTRLYVLDRHGSLLPRGAIGELHIGGDGVGKGYVGLPALTAERFRTDPFRSAAPGATMYRTGDLVRWREDGALDYLGRADHQVKLRGLRIEPGEVEAVLQGHSAVRQALVLVRPKQPAGEDMLVAYVVPGDPRDAGRAELLPELEALVRRHLPSFMHPEGIVVLPRFPLTLNGKVDRSALPAPSPRAGLGAVGELPATATERRLARIWQEVLGLGEVGTLDSFFELGGTSLLAARLLARVQAIFGRRLALAELYQASTLRELARLLDQGGGERDAAGGETAGTMQVVCLQREGSGPPIFGLHNTTVFYPLARFLGPHRPFVAVETLKRLGPGRAAVSLPEIAARYLQEIQRIQPHGPYVLLGWCAGGVIAYETAQQLRAQGQTVPLVIMVDADAPGRAAVEPVLHAALGRTSHALQRAWHHGKRLLTGRAEGGVPRLRALVEARRSRREARNERALNLVDRQMIRQLDRAIRAYQPASYVGRVLLFQRSSSPTGRFIDPTSGWGRLVAGELRIRRSPGEHVTLFRDESARFLAAQITEALAD